MDDAALSTCPARCVSLLIAMAMEKPCVRNSDHQAIVAAMAPVIDMTGLRVIEEALRVIKEALQTFKDRTATLEASHPGDEAEI